MNINLGTVEIDDETARLIHRAMNPLSRALRRRATRVEIKAWAYRTLMDEIALIGESFSTDGDESVTLSECESSAS